MFNMYDPNRWNPDTIRAQAQRSTELRQRGALGNNLVSSIIALVWILLIVLPFKLARFVVRISWRLLIRGVGWLRRKCRPRDRTRWEDWQ